MQQTKKLPRDPQIIKFRPVTQQPLVWSLKKLHFIYIIVVKTTFLINGNLWYNEFHNNKLLSTNGKMSFGAKVGKLQNPP